MRGWPEQVKLMQKNWIGKSEGVRIGFEYPWKRRKRYCGCSPPAADTLMGATFCAVAAEHPIATWPRRKILKMKTSSRNARRAA
jgi:leucyl-tRNA synthetase